MHGLSSLSSAWAAYGSSSVGREAALVRAIAALEEADERRRLLEEEEAVRDARGRGLHRNSITF